MADLVRFKDIYQNEEALSFKDMYTVEYRPGEDELVNYRAYRRKRTIGVGEGGPIGESTDMEEAQLDEIQIGWYHKTQKYHTIKHPDGSHYGVYDHSSYGKSGYEIRKIKDKDGNSLRAKESRSSKHMDRYMAGPKGGPTAAAKKWVAKHGGKIHNHKVKESVEWVCVGESTDMEEALNMQQRMKRSRLMKRMKAKIKIGRQRAKRKMADKGKLEKRANRAARDVIVRKLTKDIPKSELTYARKQEIEKRLDKPAMKARLKRMARKMFPQIRKKEVQRKKG